MPPEDAAPRHEGEETRAGRQPPFWWERTSRSGENKWLSTWRFDPWSRMPLEEGDAARRTKLRSATPGGGARSAVVQRTGGSAFMMANPADVIAAQGRWRSVTPPPAGSSATPALTRTRATCRQRYDAIVEAVSTDSARVRLRALQGHRIEGVALADCVLPQGDDLRL